MSELNTVTPAQHTPSQHSTTLMPQLHNTSPFWLKHTRIKHSPHSMTVSQHWYLPSHYWWRNIKLHSTTRRKERKGRWVEMNNRRHELSLNNGRCVGIWKFHRMIHYNSAFQWWLITVSFRYLVFISSWRTLRKVVHSSGIMFDMFCCHRNQYYDHDSRAGGIHKLCVLTSIPSYPRATKSLEKIGKLLVNRLLWWSFGLQVIA